MSDKPTMPDRTATKAVLDWIYSSTFENMSPAVKELAVLAIYDAIGGMLACSSLPVTHKTVDFIKAVGGPPHCSIIGFPFRTSVVNAALVNGILGHADEMDAVEADKALGRHIMAAVLGAALTAGQFAGASGREVVRAVVLGRELTKRVNAVAMKTDQETGRNGIDESNTMGATVSAGIAMGLSRDQLDVALSLAAMMASGLHPHTRETQHMGKSFNRGGIGARNGVSAALMAKVGYDAPRDIFDGRKGFFHSRIGLEKPGPELWTARDQEFGLRQLVMKQYAAGSPNLAPKQALLDIMSENGLVAEDIAEILAEVPAVSLNPGVLNVAYPGYQGNGILAVTALHGGVGFREVYQQRIYASPEVNSMRERIKFQARQDWKGPEYVLHAAVTVILKNGKKFRKEMDYRRMTKEDVDRKFAQIVGFRAGEAKATELARVVKRLDTLDNVADLMVQMELPEAKVDEL